MQIRSILLTSTIVGLLLPGCTTQLLTVQDKPGPQLTTGIPYALPIATGSATMTIRLVKCGAMDINGYNLTFDTAVVPTVALSPGERRLIDYSKLLDGPKTGIVEVTFHEIVDPSDDTKKIATPYIKTINAEAEDKSLAIVTDVLKIAAVVARTAMGLPSAAGGAGAALVPENSCAPAIAKLLDERTTIETALAALKAEAEADDDLAGKLADRIAGLQKLGKQIDQAGRTQLRELTLRAVARVARIDTARTMLTKFDTKNDDRLSLAVTTSIDAATAMASNTAQASENTLTKQAIRAWIASIIRTPGEAQDAIEDATDYKWLANDVKIRLDLSASDGASTTPKLTGTDPFYVREPVAGTARVCATWIGKDDAARPGQGGCPIGMVPYGTLATTIPQLGSVRSFPLKNGLGQAAKLSLELAIDQRIIKASYGKTKAGEGISSALLTAASSTSAIVEANRAKKEKDALAAETATKAKAGEPLAMLTAINDLKAQKARGLTLDAEIAAKTPAASVTAADAANASVTDTLTAIAIGAGPE